MNLLSYWLSSARHLREVWWLLLLLSLTLLCAGACAKKTGQRKPAANAAVASGVSLYGSSRILAGHADAVTALSFSGDGRYLISAAKDGHCIIWDCEAGTMMADLKLSSGPLRAVALYPDGGNVLVAGDEGAIWRVRIPDGFWQRSLEVKGDAVLSLAISSDQRCIAAGTKNKALHLWPQGVRPVHLSNFFERVSAVAFSPDGSSLVAGSAGEEVRVVDTRRGKPIGSRPFPGWVYSIAFSRSGDRLAVAGSLADLEGREVGELRIWSRVPSSQFVKSKPHPLVCYAVAFSPDGGRYATAGNLDPLVKVWDSQTGRLIRNLHGHTDGATTVSFSPNGSMVASGSRDRTVRLWNLKE